MPKGFSPAAAFACLLLLGGASDAFGWGKEAHQIVGAIADRRLSPVAKRNVAAFLGDKTVQDVADWADSKEAPEHPRRWHYVDIPPEDRAYVPAQHCPDGDCIVAKIPSFLDELRDPRRSARERANALKFLVHLIGDLHAPLNCVLDRDRGGNVVSMDFFGQQATPRLIWSSLLLRRNALPPAEYAVRLEPGASIARSALDATFAEVAMESHQLAPWTLFAPGMDATVYYENALPLAERRLQLAGVRLAALLNGALGGALISPDAPTSSTTQVPSAESGPSTTQTASLDPDPSSTQTSPADRDPSTAQTSTAEPPRSTRNTSSAESRGVHPPHAPSGQDATRRGMAATALLWVWRATGGAMVTYLTGVAAILLLAHRRGSGIVARSRLQRAALAPLRIQPAMARRLLFIGYGQRIVRRPDVMKVAEEYFGVPALLDEREKILPDRDGTALHEAIASHAASQRPLFVIGAGGAGKSTLLARLAYLGAKDTLPGALHGFTPVLVSSAHYSGDLVAAIGTALRDSASVGIDHERVTVIDLLQSGSFLILFDGLSEVFGDQKETLREVLRTTRSADLSNCRFVMTSRYVHGDVEDAQVIRLQPLDATTIETILKESNVTDTHRNRVRQQIASFGGRTIEPLLFTMMIEASSEHEAARTRSQLYERYFRKLLKIPADDSSASDPWLAWRDALERIAARFVLPDGRRGAGITHERLVDYLCGKRDDGKDEEDLPARLRRLYRVDTGEPVDLLNTLAAARLLVRERRWRFAHDTFEEYFLASYVLARVAETGTWSAPPSWAGTDTGRALGNVARFVDEMADDEACICLRTAAIPAEWRSLIRLGPADRTEPQSASDPEPQSASDPRLYAYESVRPAPPRPDPAMPPQQDQWEFIEEMTRTRDAFEDLQDPRYDEAVRLVLSTGNASASYLQRRLKLGYSRAARLIAIMEANGVVGPSEGSRPRDILVRAEDYPPPSGQT